VRILIAADYFGETTLIILGHHIAATYIAGVEILHDLLWILPDKLT